MNKPKGVLIDLDGVMYVEDRLVPGAVEAIGYLRDTGIPYRFLTNTTIKSKQTLFEQLQDMGIPAEKGQILSPPGEAANLLREQGCPRVHLVLMEDTKRDFSEFELVDADPDYVVMGKLGNRWDYALLNKIFRMLIGGARLIALHRDRYTQYRDGLKLEFGAFVAGLEYSTGQEAIVVGKPSAKFYQGALKDIGLAAEEVMMIGDDLVSDIQGAQNVGIGGVLVRTGKFREDLLEASGIEPDRVIDSIADMRELV